MKIGDMVYDYALGMYGMVVSGPWVEERESTGGVRSVGWEWRVLYEDGELQGADTNDLKVSEAAIEHEIEYMAMALAE